MKLTRAIPFLLFVLVNIWVLCIVIVTNRWAKDFFVLIDLDLPAATRMALTVGWVWPLGAMILGVVGLVVALGTRLSERLLFQAFSLIAAAELAALGIHIVSLLRFTRHIFTLGL
jgi:hypothetical protein